ncbi:hypothetical protein ACR738_08955 [Bifidobacterium longum subsp. longum]
MMPAQNQTTTSKTPPRRPRGSGSEWQDQRGTWHARKEIAPNPRTGKRRMVEAQAPTKTAARQRLQEKIKRLQREGDMPLPGTPTLGEWMDRWLNTIAPNVKPRTLETYRSDCNTIRSVIGGMRLDRITPPPSTECAPNSPRNTEAKPSTTTISDSGRCSTQRSANASSHRTRRSPQRRRATSRRPPKSSNPDSRPRRRRPHSTPSVANTATWQIPTTTAKCGASCGTSCSRPA